MIKLKLKKYKYIEEGNETINDTEYLEVLMEVQDEIQNAENTEQLTNIRNKIIYKIKDIKEKIGESFDSNRLEDVYELLKLMKFYLNLFNLAENREF